jgi:DNA invertase Pin-like site-specific DNA recombinase
MIAAIYARKSTNQNLPDAEKAVRRQIEHATAYAERMGWMVDSAILRILSIARFRSVRSTDPR